jgi:hypothetical protein
MTLERKNRILEYLDLFLLDVLISHILISRFYWYPRNDDVYPAISNSRASQRHRKINFSMTRLEE